MTFSFAALASAKPKPKQGAPIGSYTLTRSADKSEVKAGEVSLPDCDSDVSKLADPYASMSIDMTNGVKVNTDGWRVKAFHPGLITVHNTGLKTATMLLTFGVIEKKPYALLVVGGARDGKRCALSWVYSGTYTPTDPAK